MSVRPGCLWEYQRDACVCIWLQRQPLTSAAFKCLPCHCLCLCLCMCLGDDVLCAVHVHTYIHSCIRKNIDKRQHIGYRYVLAGYLHSFALFVWYLPTLCRLCSTCVAVCNVLFRFAYPVFRCLFCSVCDYHLCLYIWIMVLSRISWKHVTQWTTTHYIRCNKLTK